jgi:hypothetical protein
MVPPKKPIKKALLPISGRRTFVVPPDFARNLPYFVGDFGKSTRLIA